MSKIDILSVILNYGDKKKVIDINKEDVDKDKLEPLRNELKKLHKAKTVLFTFIEKN